MTKMQSIHQGIVAAAAVMMVLAAMGLSLVLGTPDQAVGAACTYPSEHGAPIRPAVVSDVMGDESARSDRGSWEFVSEAYVHAGFIDQPTAPDYAQTAETTACGDLVYSGGVWGIYVGDGQARGVVSEGEAPTTYPVPAGATFHGFDW